jgi:Putative MetA-pathway of phenol degradation
MRGWRWAGLVMTSAAVLGGVARLAGAQEAVSPHTAQPERPTVATHAGTVAPGWFELETGVEQDRVGPGARSVSTPTTLKLGLTSHVQLGLVLTTIRPALPGVFGIGDAAVDVKWRLADHAPLLGAFAIEPGVKLPTGSSRRGRGTGTTDLSMLAISSHAIGPVALDINVGYTRRSDGTKAALWTVSTGTTIGGRFAWAAELYGYPGFHDVPAVGVLTGPTWTIHPWFVADLGLIANVAGAQPPAIYAGLTWNVGRVW